MKPYKQSKRERWMETFEGYVREALPGHRMNWDAAYFYFNSGFESAPAAFKYIANAREEAKP